MSSPSSAQAWTLCVSSSQGAGSVAASVVSVSIGLDALTPTPTHEGADYYGDAHYCEQCDHYFLLLHMCNGSSY